MSVLALIFRFLSPSGTRGRLSILIFHRVLREPDPLFPDLPDAATFAEILRWVKSWFNVLPLDEGVRRLVAGSLPDRAAAITFDDGYVDNFYIALPQLQQHGLTATFFVATGFLDGGRMWNDTIIEAIRRCPKPVLDLGNADLGRYVLDTPGNRRVAIEKLIAKTKYLPVAERMVLAELIATSAAKVLPTDLMMTAGQVRGMRCAGMQIGAHTVSHPILTKLTAEEARREILEGRMRLEEIVGERVGLFAYPNGKFGEDYTEEHVAIVREIGFDAAVSTNWGAASARSDLMQLPRFTPWVRTQIRFGAQLAVNLCREQRNLG